MNDFKWIMSEGGPLICVEAGLAASWGGVFELSVTKQGTETDYDRACEGLPSVLTSASLKKGAALFFQEPFDTSFWRRLIDGKVFVIQIEACRIDENFHSIMTNMDESIFENPIETTYFTFEKGDLVMFDAAEPGNESDKNIIRFQINPGRYKILSNFFEEKGYSLLLHRLDRQG